MKLIRGLHNIAQQLPSSVVTIGNFDGIHVGHQALLNELKRQSQQHQAPSVVVTFEPQPKEFFAKQQTVPRLMRLIEKYLAIKSFAIDYLLCLSFNQQLAALTPQQFAQAILYDALHAKAVVVGDDFRFGAQRAGDFATLQRLGESFHYSAQQIASVNIDKQRVSSTRVREALQAGQMGAVQRFLGRPYALYGKVQRGQQLGRDLGFPTANINLHRQLVPMTGIFVVQVLGLRDQPVQGVAYVGERSTVGGNKVLLEVYLFDFSDDIYGRNLYVEFLDKLRDDVHYATVEEMVAQIQQDVVNARQYFA